MNRTSRLLLESLPPLLLLYCAVSLAIAPAYFYGFVVAKDAEGSGVVETSTFVVLAAGICFGILAVVRYWRVFPHWMLRAIVMVWILACVYFAGEEVSWGQWWFRWETPEAFSEVNRQNETNLHNTSTWLNEKPRALVEIWMLLATLVVGIARLRGKLRFAATDLREWINPYSLGISAGVLFLLSKVLENGPSEFVEEISSSEIRELLIAYFLALFLFSSWLKLSRISKEARP